MTTGRLPADGRGVMFAAMAKKRAELERKRPGRPATGTDPLVGARIARKMIVALDQFAAAEGLKSRSEAIRRILGEHLRKRGYLPKGAA